MNQSLLDAVEHDASRIGMFGVVLAANVLSGEYESLVDYFKAYEVVTPGKSFFVQEIVEILQTRADQCQSLLEPLRDKFLKEYRG